MTSQITEVLKRVLGLSLRPLLHSTLAVGPHQFAYLPSRGARDVTAHLVLTWIIGFSALRTFGIHCSDVSGAFDKVSRQRLVRKLRAKGLHDFVLHGFLFYGHGFDRVRRARVVFDGAMSDAMTLEDMVFQGTVYFGSSHFGSRP